MTSLERVHLAGVDAFQEVAGADAGFSGGAVGRSIEGLHALGAVHPDDPILRETEMQLLIKVDDRGHGGSNCEDR